MLESEVNMRLQHTRLTMTGLGLAVADQIEAGIHLRWHMDHRLGFPPGGFRLYRRKHLTPDELCIKISIAGTSTLQVISGDLTVVSNVTMISRPYGASAHTAIVVDGAAELRISCAQPMQSFTVTTEQAEGTVRLHALDGATTVASATITAPGGSASLLADRFTQVSITTEAEAGFFALCRTLVSDGADGNWEPLATLELPRNWSEAAGRLTEAEQGRLEPEFPRLTKVIDLLGSRGRRYTAVDAPAPVPRFAVQRVELLSLAALDPAIARLLGLGYLDTTADRGVAYDYRLLGDWSRDGLDWLMVTYAWHCFNLELGTPPPVPVPRGLIVQARPNFGVGTLPSDGQVMVDLTWQLPRDARGGLNPGAPILYHLYRQRQSQRGWTAATQLTDGRRVAVPVTSSGTLPTSFYADGPLAGGVYRYRLQGIDLFGRRSDRSAPATITLTDSVAPPPPVDVSVLAMANTGQTDLTVNWRWTNERRVQAGDAAAFRVYYQTTNIRPVLGTITSITSTTTVGGVTNVTTDLPASG